MKAKSRFTEWTNKGVGRNLALIVGLTVFVVGSGASYFVGNAQQLRQVGQIEDAVQNELEEVSSSIQGKLSELSSVLQAGAGFYSLRPDVDQLTWRRIIDEFSVSQNVAGVEAIGVALLEGSDVNVEYLKSFIQEGAIEIDQNLSDIKPLGAHLEATTVSGRTSLSENIQLDSGSSMFLVAPIYSEGRSPFTEEGRRQAVIGYGFSLIRPDQLLAGSIGNRNMNRNVEYQLVNLVDNTVVAATDNFALTKDNAGYEKQSRSILLVDKEVQLQVALLEDDFGLGFTPAAVFITGILLTIFVSIFVHSLLSNKFISLAAAHAANVKKTKDELLALASHQLRTPASGVKQYIGMVIQGFAGDISDEQRDMLEKAYEANERQLDIINQLLYVAKADAGQLFLEPSEIDAVELVKEACSNVKEYANKRQVKLTFRQRKAISLQADQRYVRMIIENLLTNAIKYSHPKTNVSVRVSKTDQTVLIEVKDSGVGISEADLEYLFKKFSRIDNELSRKVSGTGLGLFLAMRLAEAHRGTIHVSSEEGVGSVFTVELPHNYDNQNSNNDYRTNLKRKVDLS